MGNHGRLYLTQRCCWLILMELELKGMIPKQEKFLFHYIKQNRPTCSEVHGPYIHEKN